MAKNKVKTLGYIVLGPWGPMNLFDQRKGGQRLLYPCTDRVEVFPTRDHAKAAIAATNAYDTLHKMGKIKFRIRRLISKLPATA